MSRYADLSVEQLQAELVKWRARVDGPENDGRTTASGSATLDYWMDEIEEIESELARRSASEKDQQT